jgi:hypothetical protein
VKKKNIVKQLLGEEVVPFSTEPLPIYKCVKAEDADLSEELDEFLGEMSQDGATVSLRELEALVNDLTTRQELADEISMLVQRVQKSGATCVILV